MVRRLGLYATVAVGALVGGVARFFVPLAAGGTVAVLVLLALQQLLGDGAQTAAGIARTSYLQESVPAAGQARVHATFRLVDQFAMLVGLLGGGLLGQLTSLRLALLVSAVGTTVCALAFIPWWRGGRLPRRWRRGGGATTTAWSR